jgi:hypothetical protein
MFIPLGKGAGLALPCTKAATRAARYMHRTGALPTAARPKVVKEIDGVIRPGIPEKEKKTMYFRKFRTARQKSKASSAALEANQMRCAHLLLHQALQEVMD